MKRCCLVIVENKNNVLMVKNKRGINKGFYNLPGGKINIDETNIDGAIREVEEETGITPKNLKSLGKIEFYPTNMEVFIYHANEFSGKLKKNNGEENEAFWIDKNNIPYNLMRSTDLIWLKPLLKNKNYINKRLYFNDDMSLNKIEDIYENIQKYKIRYMKYLKLRELKNHKEK